MSLLPDAFSGHDFDIEHTKERDHATELARDASRGGADVVVVFGGDGTLNEAANGLIKTSTTLGVLPGGSTNVFARTIGFSNNPLDAAAELKEAMATERQRRVGLGKANDRYFLFHLGVGFDAAVVEGVEKRASMKRFAGHQFFAWKALLTWSKYATSGKPRFSVRYLDRPSARSINGYFTICMNTDPYTFFLDRPLNLAPGFGFDNSLAVITVKKLKGPSFPMMIASTLMGGSYLRRHPATSFRSSVRDLEITSPEAFPYQLDGDFLGEISSLRVTYVPDVLNLYLGPNPTLSKRRRWSRSSSGE